MRKSWRALALPALLALAVLLAGCAMPPYDEELSLAQVTRSKLGQPVNRIGPVYAQLDDNSRQTPFTFLPDRNDLGTMGGGFLMATASYGLRVWYLAYYSTNGGLSSSWAMGLENASGTANSYLLQPLRSASGGVLSLIRYLPSTSYLANDIITVTSTDPTILNPITPVPLSGLLNTAPPPTVLAAGSNIYPLDSTFTYDLQYFLGYALETGQYIEYKSQTSQTSGVSLVTAISGSYFTLSPLPAGLRNVFYGRDDFTGLSYLSYWSAAEGKYKSYSWTATSIVPPPMDPPDLRLLSGIKGRIDALLTSGQLLSFENNSCTVYDKDGQKLYDFPLGDLKFCYEQWDPVGLQFKLYFSLAYWLYGRDQKPDKLYVEAYAIPTASLASLR